MIAARTRGNLYSWPKSPRTGAALPGSLAVRYIMRGINVMTPTVRVRQRIQAEFGARLRPEHVERLTQYALALHQYGRQQCQAVTRGCMVGWPDRGPEAPQR